MVFKQNIFKEAMEPKFRGEVGWECPRVGEGQQLNWEDKTGFSGSRKDPGGGGGVFVRVLDPACMQSTQVGKGSDHKEMLLPRGDFPEERERSLWVSLGSHPEAAAH